MPPMGSRCSYHTATRAWAASIPADAWERYLQMCAQDNMQVANPTTPANHFHLLRRQVLRPFRKPLVVFTPKKLLRYPEAVSTMAELAEGRFQPVIDDPQRRGSSSEHVTHVVLCTGKFYYDLLEERKKRVQAGEMDNIALVRLEQLYPFPTAELGAVLDRYEGATLCWAQEEPANMGGLAHMHRFGPGVTQFFSRPASASPASGRPSGACGAPQGHHRFRVQIGLTTLLPIQRFIPSYRSHAYPRNEGPQSRGVHLGSGNRHLAGC